MAEQPPHFILFPFMAQGHLLPMADIGKLLAQHGAIVTIITTPINAARIRTVLACAISSGLQIRILELRFPYQEAGIPEGCENMDSISMELRPNFITVVNLLQDPAEKLLEEIQPPPSCIISDMPFTWTIDTARKFNVPRICFNGFSCFALLCWRNLVASRAYENVRSDSEYFLIPGLPDQIQITKSQAPMPVAAGGPMQAFVDKMVAADQASYGVIINTFEELEDGYVKQYKKLRNGKVWCVGPVSLSNKDNADKAERGNKASIGGLECTEWLDSRQVGSVLYVCLGSLCNFTTPQLIELGLGLEASNKPFIWVVRQRSGTEELEKWFREENFDDRIKGRGLVIRGWAPQLLILSHPSVGGFLTHCGWNSSVEGISAGLQMLTWPLFGDQFCNEKLITQVLGIGVRIGVETPLELGEEEKIGVLVKKEQVVKAVHELMDEGEAKDERRRRARQLKEIANGATEEGGSSYMNMNLLIQDIMQQGREM